MFFLFADGVPLDLFVEITKGNYNKVEEFTVINGGWHGVVDYENKQVLSYDFHGKLKNKLDFQGIITGRVNNKLEDNYNWPKRVITKKPNEFLPREVVLFQNTPNVWQIGLFVESRENESDEYPFVVTTYLHEKPAYHDCRIVVVCIPLKGNEHLLGTTNTL